jgi:hypothetical protein
VSAESQPPPRPAATRRAAEIRIDPPQPRIAQVRRHAAAERPPRPAVESRRRDIPPDRRPAALNDFARTAPARPSPLPPGSPFAIPSERLQDQFAPLVQFLLLFVLFTAAGTSLLMIRKSPAAGAADSTAATVDPAIAVPTAAKSTSGERPSIETPAPVGPSGPTSDVTVAPAEAPAPPSFALGPGRNSAAGRDADVPAVAQVEARGEAPAFVAPPRPAAEGPAMPTQPPAGETAPLPYPATNFPPTALPSASDHTLPQARTTDPPTAVARLRGDIGKIPPR